jgi:hypothetical protein
MVAPSDDDSELSGSLRAGTFFTNLININVRKIVWAVVRTSIGS